MKRLAILCLALLLTGLAWHNRNSLFFLLYSYFERPEKVEFSQYDAGRIRIFYVKSNYLSMRIDSIAKQLSENLGAAEKEIGVSLKPVMKVYLYNTWEEKGNHVKDIRVAHASVREHSLHYIVNDHFDGTRERLEYELLLDQRYGAAASSLLADSVTAALSSTWNQKTLLEWAEFLLSRNVGPRFPEFLGQNDHVSEYILYPWDAIFARFVREKYGWDALIQLYKHAQPPSGFQKSWAESLAKLDPRHETSSYVFIPQFQKGISYAYANSYDGGYATRKSAQSLDELKRVGVEWLAAIPYGFMRSLKSTQIESAGHSIFGESDESMIALAIDTKLRGMKVMLKPQIWIHYNSWPGEIDFSDDASWNQWMNCYEGWITHYAILSELMGADLFCIGTELVESTLKQPERWRKIIAHIRQIYHGPLVYAANYGKEFEGISFWDSLDYIGLDNYYPVRSSTHENATQMRAAFQQQKQKLQAIALRYRKPLLFTEVGYMANEGAGTGPEEPNFRTYDERMQAECYRLMLETYWNEPWFSGMYWWKWFSDPTDRGQGADSHSPHGRAAEAILKKWYTQEIRHEQDPNH